MNVRSDYENAIAHYHPKSAPCCEYPSMHEFRGEHKTPPPLPAAVAS